MKTDENVTEIVPITGIRKRHDDLWYYLMFLEGLSLPMSVIAQIR